MTSKATPAARPKGDKRARTRATLLEAARELIREKGYEHTTLEDVARRAGMTSGAIYGNFKNRDELFIALAETYWAPIKPTIRRARASPRRCARWPRRRSRRCRSGGAPRSAASPAWPTRSPTRRCAPRCSEITAESYGCGAAWLRAVADDGELPMPPEHPGRA